ncbi:hypothetical protein [Clostridium sp. DL1XJH146]
MIKRMSVLSILVIISFLFVGCDNKDQELTETRTYSNIYYTIKYPSNWLEPVEDRGAVSFSTEDNEVSLNITTTRIYPYTENYIEEIIKKVEEDINVEECIVGGNKGYKIKIEEDDKINIAYIVQEKDMFFEILFECLDNAYDNYKALINRIDNNFEFNDFEKLETSSNYIIGQRDDKWLADIEFLTENLPKVHKNLFFKVEEEEFSANIKKIKKEIPTLTDDEIIVELSRLIASIGDSHTSFVFNSEEVYPLKFYYFDDGIYLIDSAPEYSQYIGFKLKEINGKSVEEIIELFRPIISYENESWFKKKFAEYIARTEFLNGLKITDTEIGKFVFIDKNGNEESVEVEPSKLGLQNASADKAEKMLYLKNSEKNYWYEFLEEDKLLYFQYNSCYNMKEKSFSDFNKELFDFIDNNSINTFVIDLRNNLGGDSLLLDPFFDELKERESLDQPQKLFVIVGRNTYSSAIVNTLKFKNETNAIFIGEPTGGKPNHYGVVDKLELSNTNTIVSFSTNYLQISNEDLDSFVPDIIIEPNADDYFNNIDPVMVRILEFN